MHDEARGQAVEPAVRLERAQPVVEEQRAVHAVLAVDEGVQIEQHAALCPAVVVDALEHEDVRAVPGEHVRRQGRRARELVLKRAVDGVVHELYADIGVLAVEFGGKAVDAVLARVVVEKAQGEAQLHHGLQALVQADERPAALARVHVVVGDEEAAVLIDGVGALGDAELEVVAELFVPAGRGVEAVEREAAAAEDAALGPCGVAHGRGDVKGPLELASRGLEQPGGIARLVQAGEQQPAVHRREGKDIAAALAEQALGLERRGRAAGGVDEDTELPAGLGDEAEPALGACAEDAGARDLREGLRAEAAKLRAVFGVAGVAPAGLDVRAPAAPERAVRGEGKARAAPVRGLLVERGDKLGLAAGRAAPEPGGGVIRACLVVVRYKFIGQGDEDDAAVLVPVRGGDGLCVLGHAYGFGYVAAHRLRGAGCVGPGRRRGRGPVHRGRAAAR